MVFAGAVPGTGRGGIEMNIPKPSGRCSFCHGELFQFSEEYSRSQIENIFQETTWLAPGKKPEFFVKELCNTCGAGRLIGAETPVTGFCKQALPKLHHRVLNAFGELVVSKSKVSLWPDEILFDWNFEHGVNLQFTCLLDDSEANLELIKLSKIDAMEYHRKYGDCVVVSVAAPDARPESWEDFPHTDEWPDFPNLEKRPNLSSDLEPHPQSLFVAYFFSGLIRRGASPDPSHLALPYNFCEAAASKISPQTEFSHESDCWALSEESLVPVFEDFLKSPLSLIENPAKLELFGNQIWHGGFRATDRANLEDLLSMGAEPLGPDWPYPSRRDWGDDSAHRG